MASTVTSSFPPHPEATIILISVRRSLAFLLCGLHWKHVFRKYAYFSCFSLYNDVIMLDTTTLLRSIHIIAFFCSMFILPPV